MALGSQGIELWCFYIFMNIQQLFFELIQVAIGTRSYLSHTPSADEWGELYAMAKKQSLVGVCFAGVQKLQTQRQEPPEMLYLTWMGMAAKIQQRNEVVNRQCVELQTRLSADGIRSTILKGQGIATLYGEHLKNLRQSGDIDIYVDCGRKKAIEYARKLQGDVDWDYKHLHLHVFHDTEVEMHYVPEIFLNLWKNRKLQRWFNEYQELMFGKNEEFVTPSVAFNQVYILLHTYRHFLYEGVGLRQVMDYYFVLRCAKLKDECSDVARYLSDLGLLKFAKAMMWVLQDVFGLEDNYMICEPDEKEGRYLLEQIVRAGNFGKHDDRLKAGNTKMTEVKNVFRHSGHLLFHYTSDVIWSPFYFLWHFTWKRIYEIKFNNI